MCDEPKLWFRVPPYTVRTVWQRQCKHRSSDRIVTLDPENFADSGTPICEHCGADYKFLRCEQEQRDEPIVVNVFNSAVISVDGIPPHLLVEVRDQRTGALRRWNEFGETQE